MANERTRTDLRSETMQDIMTRVPAWVTRWGTTVLVLFFAALFVFAAVIRYPDVVRGDAVLTTVRPPIGIHAPRAAIIDSLFVEEGGMVGVGDVLFTTRSETRLHPADAMRDHISSMVVRPLDSLRSDSVPAPPRDALGELGDEYARHREAFGRLVFALERDPAPLTEAGLEGSVARLRAMNATLREQLSACRTEQALLETNARNDRDLRDRGVISERQYQETLTEFEEKRSACRDLEVAMDANRVRMSELEVERITQDVSGDENILVRYSEWLEAAEAYLVAFDAWSAENVVVAPVAGRVSFQGVRDAGQYVEPQERVLTLVQPDSPIRVTARLPQRDIGKVLPGQDVQLKLDGYDYYEFGAVMGRVEAISPVADEDVYRVEVDLVDGLTTPQGHTLGFRQGMTATAEVITSERSVLQRLVGRLWPRSGGTVPRGGRGQ